MISLNIDGREVRVARGDYDDVVVELRTYGSKESVVAVRIIATRDEALALSHALELCGLGVR